MRAARITAIAFPIFVVLCALVGPPSDNREAATLFVVFLSFSVQTAERVVAWWERA